MTLVGHSTADAMAVDAAVTSTTGAVISASHGGGDGDDAAWQARWRCIGVAVAGVEVAAAGAAWQGGDVATAVARTEERLPRQERWRGNCGGHGSSAGAVADAA
jgi:hypothetical protein